MSVINYNLRKYYCWYGIIKIRLMYVMSYISIIASIILWHTYCEIRTLTYVLWQCDILLPVLRVLFLTYVRMWQSKEDPKEILSHVSVCTVITSVCPPLLFSKNIRHEREINRTLQDKRLAFSQISKKYFVYK